MNNKRFKNPVGTESAGNTISDNGLLRRTYDKSIEIAGSRYALLFLAVVSFLESSIFPIPPDLFMIPMILAAPRRAFIIAGVCTASSVLGGLAGYWIGAVSYEQIGKPVLEFFGKTEYFSEFMDSFNRYGAWAVLVAGLTPFPYKVVTILSGATSLSLPVFVISSVIARGARFFIVAALLRRFGEPIREFVERKLGLVMLAALIILIALYFGLKSI